MTIPPFKSGNIRRKPSDKTMNNLFRHMEMHGCFNLAMVVRVVCCHMFDCGNKGLLPDGTIQLSGYEVQPVVSTCMLSGKTESVNLYYHTKSAADSQLAMQIFSRDSVLLVKGSYMDLEQPFTLYIANLESVTALPAELVDAARWLLERDEHAMRIHHG